MVQVPINITAVALVVATALFCVRTFNVRRMVPFLVGVYVLCYAYIVLPACLFGEKQASYYHFCILQMPAVI